MKLGMMAIFDWGWGRNLAQANMADKALLCKPLEVNGVISLPETMSYNKIKLTYLKIS